MPFTSRSVPITPTVDYQSGRLQRAAGFRIEAIPVRGQTYKELFHVTRHNSPVGATTTYASAVHMVACILHREYTATERRYARGPLNT